MSTTLQELDPTIADLLDRVVALEARVLEPHAPVLDELLTAPMLSRRIGQTERTLSEWRIRGEGPAFIRVGRSVRYRPDVVDAWLLSREVSSTAEELA